MLLVTALSAQDFDCSKTRNIFYVLRLGEVIAEVRNVTTISGGMHAESC
jgi:hypothetical protein